MSMYPKERDYLAEELAQNFNEYTEGKIEDARVEKKVSEQILFNEIIDCSFEIYINGLREEVVTVKDIKKYFEQYFGVKEIDNPF